MKNLWRLVFWLFIVANLFYAYQSTQQQQDGSPFCDRIWNRLLILPVEATPYRLNLEDKFFMNCGTFTKYQGDEVQFIR